MKVLHVISGLSRESGGPSRSCQGLVAGLNSAGIEAWLISLYKGEEPWIDGVAHFVNGGSFEVAVERIRPDIVHIHCIWSPALHRCAVICRRRKIPYVIAPRGMLEPWSLQQKWLKKQIARFFYQDRDLKCAAALHATAESEAEQFRKLGFKNPIIVSPNGVNVPICGVKEWVSEGVKERDANLAEVTFEASSKHHKKLPRLMPLTEAVKMVVHRQVAAGSNPSPTRNISYSSSKNKGVNEKKSHRVLFVSRMHPKKGVLELVEAWGRLVDSGQWLVVSGWCCELVYTVSGEFERAYEAKVRARVKELGLEGQFIFTGALNDDEKWAAYARADLFVLPTYSENFGIVVAEALWAGVPVITTKGTPWKELEDRKCGKWIDLPTEGSNSSDWPALVSALECMMSMPAGERRQMGENGRQLVDEKYTWDAVVKAMVKGYESIIDSR